MSTNKCPKCDTEFTTIHVGEISINLIKDPCTIGDTVVILYSDGDKKITSIEKIIKGLKDVQSTNNKT